MRLRPGENGILDPTWEYESVRISADLKLGVERDLLLIAEAREKTGPKRRLTEGEVEIARALYHASVERNTFGDMQKTAELAQALLLYEAVALETQEDEIERFMQVAWARRDVLSSEIVVMLALKGFAA